ncbi:MAG: DnaA/Hda family protein [Pseudomonadota bacterium]|nr:DnaA/Hda family protein [Pseudomonadota bacterium]
MKKANFTDNQIPIDFRFVTEKTFDNFIVGNNGAIIESLLVFPETKPTNIITIYGEKSSGKTHLCQATKNISENKSIYINSDNIEQLEIKGDYISFMIIDDIDLILKKFNVEEKIFTLVNDFILNNKGMLITSTINPKKIEFRIPDLLSRLSWGLSFKINDLSDLDKIKVLKKYSHERGLTLSPLVCDYIITHFKRELYYLCNSIRFLDQKSLSLKKKITIPFIKKIIELKSS